MEVSQKLAILEVGSLFWCYCVKMIEIG